MARLIYIPYSPWSERARWALDHHGIDYTRSVYTPMLSEPGLRLALRRLGGRVTVPVLFDGDAVLDDSLAIARHAEVHGRGTPLFPVAERDAIEAWHARADAAMEAARALTTRRLAEDPEALAEQLPPGLPRAFRPLARVGVGYFIRKYGLAARDLAADRACVADALRALRTALDGREHVAGDGFTYADILAAMIVPGPIPRARMGDASRRAFTDPELADEFADLIAWRAGLYDAHR